MCLPFYLVPQLSCRGTYVNCLRTTQLTAEPNREWSHVQIPGTLTDAIDAPTQRRKRVDG